MLVIPQFSVVGVTCYSLLVVLAYHIAYRTSSLVDYQFIDEFFHVRQTLEYVAGNWHDWDAKITTPPGLYVLALGYIKLFHLQPTLATLRSLNLVGGLVVLPLVLRHVHQRSWLITNIIAQPLLFTYYFLFYTDVWSTVFITASLVAALAQKSWLSGVLGLLSLSFRQTNIVWLAFIFSVFIDNQCQGNFGLTRFYKFVPKLFRTSTIPYYVNFVAFGIFLKVNGGITFGDKENHEVSLHGAQVLYCLVFMCAFTVPVWLDTNLPKRYLRAWTGNHGANTVISVLALIVIVQVIRYGTIVHPFLLADNRHYPFYLWRKVISKVGAWAAPGYHVCGFIILDQLSRARRLSWITISTFFGAMMLTLVPSPLFEPRYYILPVMFFRMFIKPTGHRHLVEFGYLLIINIAVFGVFLAYEFAWATEDYPQRIIW